MEAEVAEVMPECLITAWLSLWRRRRFPGNLKRR
jgi:hypothetical protein